MSASTGEPLAAARDRLMQAALAAVPPPGARFARVEVPVEPVSPLQWLAAQPHKVKGYWSARNGSLEVAAVGEADEFKTTDLSPAAAFRTIRSRLAYAAPECRYYGGFRFGPWHPADRAWLPFGASRFLLPEVELVRRGDAHALACNLPVGSDTRAQEALAALAQTMPDVAARRGPLPEPLSRDDVPDRAAWDRAVASVRSEIGAGRLKKLVLARRACFDFGQPLNAFELLLRLKERTNDCYHFGGIHAGGHVAFMGAPPERLFMRTDREVLSEAVAGTRPRGATPEEDAALASGLLNDPKEREEHAIVVQGIVEAMQSLCIGVKHEPVPHVVKLTSVQHLVTHIVGTLRHGVRDEDVLATLHPTPAVGGYPRDAALATLHHLETFDRGWYAGPVGWIAREACEFAVAIRCGAILDSKLLLYSGAGIVSGSDAASEWDEVEYKIGHFIAALTEEQ